MKVRGLNLAVVCFALLCLTPSAEAVKRKRAFRSVAARPIAARKASAYVDVNPSADWVTHARRLSGESDVIRNQSIAWLRHAPKIEETLRQALTQPERYLALDVISTLKLGKLLPDLIRISEHDVSGTSYLTLNTLITSFNEKESKELYAKRLLAGNSPPVARMILLDTLLRMRFRLSPSQLRTLVIKDDSPEVRSSALAYLRQNLLIDHDDDFLPLLKEVLEEEKTSPQRRIQALFIAKELPPDAFQKIRDLKSPCPLPQPDALQFICAQFAQAGHQ